MAAGAEPVAAWFGWRIVDAVCRRTLGRDALWTVEGAANVPARGPTLLVARHVHHGFDGCLLQQTLPRPLRLLVALDWVRPGWQRRGMAWACRSLGWPTVVRSDNPTGVPPAEASRLLLAATRDAVRLLRAGEMLLVFPEGYPNVDPNPTPKADLDAWLPFAPGFARLARLAEADGTTRVAVVPVGFAYRCGADHRWRIACRVGPPLRFEGDETAFVAAVEARVRALSA